MKIASIQTDIVALPKDGALAGFSEHTTSTDTAAAGGDATLLCHRGGKRRFDLVNVADSGLRDSGLVGHHPQPGPAPNRFRRGPCRQPRERLKSTLLGHSASHSERLFLPQTGPSHSSGFCVFAVRQSATPVFISLTRWCPARLH